MLVAEALNTDTRVLNQDDSVGRALEQMTELELNKLPVVDRRNNELVGQVTRSKLERVNDSNTLIHDLELENPTVIFNSQHLFHAVRLMFQYEMDMLPVVDDEWIFQGVIQKYQVLETVGQMLNLTEYGSIITIELNKRDLSLSEIVHLIETEGGKILGITVETPNEKRTGYEVSVKLNLKDVSRVASSLRRHGYTIRTEVKSEKHNIDLETRADEFLQYLDI